MLNLRSYLRCIPTVGLLCLAGCPSNPNSATDTTPPNVNPVIQLGSPPPDTVNNGISVAAGDVTRLGIPGNITIRLIAPATDPESKVTSFYLESNLKWQCYVGVPIPVGIGQFYGQQTAPLAFSPTITSTPNSATQYFDGVVDSIAMTGCSTAQPDFGSFNVIGSVRVVAVNGVGLTTKSPTFNFTYKDVGHPVFYTKPK